MYRVLIVDDHESMCDSLKIALTRTGNFAVVGSLTNAIHSTLYCERLKPDLVLMDVCTENGTSGLDAAEALKEQFPLVKIVVMSGFDEISYVPRAIEVGADAFVFKSKSLAFFVNVAELVMNGKTYFPESKSVPVQEGEPPLTEREMEVLRLMCKHLTSKEIAQEIFISESTVKYHKSNMMSKTGFSKAADLAFYMIVNGWINPLY